MELTLNSAVDKNRGRDFLEHRSSLNKSIQALDPIGRILVVEDNPDDAHRLTAALRRVLGHNQEIGLARTEQELQADIARKLPQLMFLDDRLDRRTRAERSIPLIRAAGYAGPIVIVAETVTRERGMELARLAVRDVIHKEDLTNTRLAEAILRVFGPDATGGGPLQL